MRILDVPEQWNKVLSLLPDESIRNLLNNAWLNAKKPLTSVEKWDQIENEIRRAKV